MSWIAMKVKLTDEEVVGRVRSRTKQQWFGTLILPILVGVFFLVTAFFYMYVIWDMDFAIGMTHEVFEQENISAEIRDIIRSGQKLGFLSGLMAGYVIVIGINCILIGMMQWGFGVGRQQRMLVKYYDIAMAQRGNEQQESVSGGGGGG